MGEDSTRAEASCSATLPANMPSETAAAAADPQPPPSPPASQQEEPPLLIPSFSSVNSAPSSPGGTLKRLSMALKAGPAGPTPMSPTSPTGGQVSAITVVALLDRLVAMMETVQENQRRAERRQAELETAVRTVQGDVTRLAKHHTGTANSVNKLLERSRKTGGHVKEVRERLDRQGTQVKRLEANHAHLLKRNHFKVLIFQEDHEIPSSLHLKDPGTISVRESQGEDVSVGHPPTPNADTATNHHSHEEGLQTISLTSDDDEEEVGMAAGTNLSSPRGEGYLDDDDDDDDGLQALSSERPERSRADKLKRSSLKKVDSLKKAFSRQSIEKKINKIVPPERREKIKKSFTPNHPKSPTAKSSSFKVSPMTFTVKKVRDGGPGTGAAGEPVSPEAHVDVPSLGGPSGELSLAEVHSLDDKEKGAKEASASSSLEVGLSVDGEIDGELNGEVERVATATLAVEETVPDHIEVDDDDEEEEEAEHNGEASPVASPASPASPVNAAVAVEQAS